MGPLNQLHPNKRRHVGVCKTMTQVCQRRKKKG